MMEYQIFIPILLSIFLYYYTRVHISLRRQLDEWLTEFIRMLVGKKISYFNSFYCVRVYYRYDRNLQDNNCDRLSLPPPNHTITSVACTVKKEELACEIRLLVLLRTTWLICSAPPTQYNKIVYFFDNKNVDFCVCRNFTSKEPTSVLEI